MKKSQKLNRLADDIDKTPHDWKTFITNAHKDRELMQGHFSHNTRNLLTNLQNEKFDLYIKEEVVEKNTPKLK